MNLPTILRRKPPATPVVKPLPVAPTTGEADRLTVKLFPPSIEAVGAGPVAMVPFLLIMVAIIFLFGPAVQSGAQYGKQVVADVYERIVSPNDEPPD